MHLRSMKWMVFVLAQVVVVVFGGTLLYIHGWKNGYVSAKNDQFLEVSLTATNYLWILRNLENENIDWRKVIEGNFDAQVGSMRALDAFIRKIETERLSLEDVASLSIKRHSRDGVAERLMQARKKGETGTEPEVSPPIEP